jgi:xylan 1,4-beta-xylosidase
MEKINKTLLVVTMISVLATSFFSKPLLGQETFCNPLNLNYRFMSDAIDAREAADAVIVLFKDDYYLFASRSGGYWTSPDLREWTLIVPEVLDVETYAPAVVAMRDSLFYVPSQNSQVYKTGDPKSGIWQKGARTGSYGDPALFLDDNGKLYMSYGLSSTTPTSIVELDPFTFKEIGSKVDVVHAQANIHGWERRGDDNLLDEQPWIEGTWMIKENGKYFLHYAGPGTEFKTYADGIYTADSPLGPYEYATYSPFSFKPTGFISGAGHGCTFKAKDGNYWHIGTMTISVKHMFERRLGLSPVAVDEDGHIHCNTAWGDYPQYFPGIMDHPADSNFTGMMLLSHKKFALASSSLEDHGVKNAVDEDARTYWSAQSGGDEWILVDLGTECTVEAIQVNFAEHNTDPVLVRGRDNILYEQYIIERSQDGMSWEMLVDKSENLEDVPDDYIELEQPVTVRYIKLSNVFTPGGGNFAVRDLRIFGNSDQAVFTTINDNDVTVERDPGDGRDAVLRWTPVEHADGYIIQYGIAPDKLYNNYMVYDIDTLAIHSLNHGVDYYFRVRAFDSGTDYYSGAGEFYSFQSGNWNDVNTWTLYDGSDSINPAPNIPSVTDGPITVLEGHSITVTENDTADQLRIEAGAFLDIGKGVTFHMHDGISTDLAVEGTVRNYGSITGDTLATLSFSGNGTYEHRQDGGAIPEAIWRPSSICVIDSVKTNVPSNGNQDFYNIRWNCPDQTGDLSLSWNGITIGGDILIESTGTGQWQMCDPEPGESIAITLKGNIHQSGGAFSATGSDNVGTSIMISQEGNTDISGGDFSICRGTQGGDGTLVWMLYGNVTMAVATTQNANPGGAKFVFAGDGSPQMLSFSEVTFGSGGFPVEVASGATLDMGTSVLGGDGSFDLKTGATLLTAHENGINGSLTNTGARTFSEASNFGFNGSSAQVTGDMLPGKVNNLIINNPSGVTLSDDVTVEGILELVEGGLSSGGGALIYGTDASLKYSGTKAQITTDVEFPSTSGPGKLIAANRNLLTLHDSRTIHHLDLQRKLDLGPNTLTVDSISGGTFNTYIITEEGGTLKNASVGDTPVFFPVGTNSYGPVWITNTGAVDGISVGVVKDANATSGGNSVRMIWNLSEDTPGGGEYTLQFGWLPGMEGSGFKADRANLAKIISLTDTTEAGSGAYTTQFSTTPYTLSRGGITVLGPFGIGEFVDQTVGIDNPEARPGELALYQNQPNPFNSSTWISFAIPVQSFVNLKIYNLLGEEITDIAGREFLPGTHNVLFDASELNSGIYFYALRVNDAVLIKKMILMR